MAKTLTIILSAILVIALAATGYIYFTSHSQITNLQSQITNLQSQIAQGNLNITLTKADTFDARLHDLLQEHTFLLINTIRRSFDSSASYNASLVALQNNINEVGTLLTPIYGTNAQQLVGLWNNKTMIFIAYSNDMKSGNPNANTNFASAAQAYEAAVATFWASTNNPYPTFDYNTMLSMSTVHINDVKAAVDSWNAKDYPTYFANLEVAYDQMGQYADVIAQGIINQHTELFQ
jgi:hypothetical protein